MLVDAALGYTGTYTVVNRVAGTVTWLPATGRVVHQGEVLYRVDGRPVLLLYGTVPAYRALGYGMKGRDVSELNTALRALGYTAPRTNVFTAATAYAVERLQRRKGLPRTGRLELGQAVFLHAKVRVTARAGVLGGPVRPGAAVLTATSTTPVVTVHLDAGRQADVHRRDKVTITLPGGRTTPGVVAAVGNVARPPKSGASPAVTVTVIAADPKATGGLDQAPVQVSIVTGGVRDALVVPVSALLAQAGGGYAVEVTEPRGLVRVSPGLFDDADGLVEVTGRGLYAGRRVVVPGA
jgi:hypothetical protein